MKIKFCFYAVLTVIFSSCVEVNPLETVLESNDPKIKEVVDQLEKHEVQILLTTIDKNKEGSKTFNSFEFGIDKNKYFYPASTVKFPVAVLALQRLNELKDEGVDVDMNTPFIIKNSSGDMVAEVDSTSKTNKLSIAHLIKKVFLVSDNAAYNYLFDFLGRDYIYTSLKQKGYNNVQIMHKFIGATDNINTWEYEFFDDSLRVYNQKSITSVHNFDKSSMTHLIKGKGYYDAELDDVINEPFNFSEKNFIAIPELHKILKAIVFPESLEESERFDLTDQDHSFLKEWMHKTPFQSDYPNYRKKKNEYWDSYVKFVMFGDSKEKMPAHIKSFNKVGLAYGTLTETTFIQDKINDIEFMLTATILVNENGIFNDGVYEYDEVGIPFLAEIGRQIYEIEKKKTIGK